LLPAVLLLAGAASCSQLTDRDDGARVVGKEEPATQSVSARDATGRYSLDEGWLFHAGDIPFPVISGHGASYSNAKAGRVGGAAAPGFDDSEWRRVDLPHDWAVEQPIVREANLSQGYRPRGIGWYRRYFRLDPGDKGKHIELQLDGIATYAAIYFNGTVVHRNWCGYTSAYIDLTSLVKFDDVNTIAIRVDAESQEGWWYEGAGIYRHTWLVKRSPIHIATDGVYAVPVRQSDGTWNLPIEVTIDSSASTPDNADPTATESDVGLSLELIGPSGRRVGVSTSVTVRSLQSTVWKLDNWAIDHPVLWSPDHPALYTLRTTLYDNGKVLDTVDTRIGFRTLRFDPNLGFFLNDQPLKLQGTCNHMDHAGVGVAVPDSLWDFRIRKLKEMGSNAYRCSHNPPPREFLDACDRLGMLVMDENRNFNPTPEYLRQLQWMVRRDRNHPSVILWSVFNEEPMQGTEQGYEMVRRMSAAVRELDRTRPVTAAMSGGLSSPRNVSQAVDVVGINYQQVAYDSFHNAHPTIPLTSSEDTSAFMTRGEYFTDKSRNIIGSYDTEHAGWGATHRNGWKAIATRPFVAGGFCWTGFDYRGEPTPHSWPSASSFFGCMDTCGFPKVGFYIHQAQWLRNQPVLQLAPHHWTFPGMTGKTLKVLAITNAQSVSLSLNGKPLGSKPVDPFDFVTFDVPYEPGRLEAVAIRDGREVARQAIETTSAAASLALMPDRAQLAGDGCDAVPITVQALDDQGRPAATAGHLVRFTVEGPGEIIGVGNGDPNCHEPDKADSRSLFNGLAQVIVRARRGGTADIRLRAAADGLRPAETTIRVNPALAPPSVAPTSPSVNLVDARISPVLNARPDPAQPIPENDQNTWVRYRMGQVTTLEPGQHILIRIPFSPRKRVREHGGVLTLERVTGVAEVYLDGKRVNEKGEPNARNLQIPLPAGTGEHTLTLLLSVRQANGGVSVGRAFLTAIEPEPQP
jgi:beta-galactosidase